jgi:hypothetical protein
MAGTLAQRQRPTVPEGSLLTKKVAKPFKKLAMLGCLNLTQLVMRGNQLGFEFPDLRPKENRGEFWRRAGQGELLQLAETQKLQNRAD